MVWMAGLLLLERTHVLFILEPQTGARGVSGSSFQGFIGRYINASHCHALPFMSATFGAEGIHLSYGVDS